MKTFFALPVNLPNKSILFKALGDETRLGILWMLMNEDLCVGDLADRMSMSKSSISHQLRVLRSVQLVKRRRAGKKIFYAIKDEKQRAFLINIFGSQIEINQIVSSGEGCTSDY
ncbi:metalloregulator ArsR/SmtB family transcription factor [Lacrimispora sp.]|uniref:ArsR/SmtB family transcription factor n=1 Tax=Lacrimispora sp. TaxID=2719234 RepID=UPI0029E70162|nr:ArsR family transcriptional regulator, lead/cadmium/zinc/bismuth-responsive transcriptional [Lacrimispora sp.]